MLSLPLLFDGIATSTCCKGESESQNAITGKLLTQTSLNSNDLVINLRQVAWNAMAVRRRIRAKQRRCLPGRVQLVKGTQVLAMLPENLRSRVVLELCGEAVSQIPCCRGRVLEDLALSLKLDLYAPESYLFRAGECAARLFIVAAGGVALDTRRATPKLR